MSAGSTGTGSVGTGTVGTGAPRIVSSSPSRVAITASSVVDIVVVVVLSVLAVIGFEPAFGHYGFLIAGIGGLVIGAAVALLCTLLRLSVLTTVAVGLASYFLFGTPLTMPAQALYGVLPSVDSLSGLVFGAVFGWSDAVTLQAPVQAPPYIAVIPFFASWLVALVTVLLALRWLPRKPRTALRSSVLLIGPAALFLAAILLGTGEAYYAGVRGVVFAAGAIVWLGWRRARTGGLAVSKDGGLKRRKIVGTAVVVLGAVVVGTLLGTLVSPPAASRYVLRQEVTPPFDPLNYPSPLAGFREYTKDLQKTDLFTVDGVKSGELIRLATMDSYNGIVWSVAGPDTRTDGSGTFQLLGRDIPRPPLFTPGAQSTATITIQKYDDVWLPALGYVTTLDFDSYTGTDPTTTVRVNTTTGTTAVTSGVGPGMKYTIGVTAQKALSDKALANVPPARITMPPVTNVPDVVSAKAEEYAGSATSAIQKLRNIERSLKTIGYLSHGRASDPVPSRAGEGADRMTDLFTKQPMVGDQEQYASAFALMARHLGYPARVVMGFKPTQAKGTSRASVTGDDVTAWVEVAFDKVGWVPFFPTPDKTDAPKDQTTKPKLQPQPQVRQPPRTNPKTDELLTPVKTKDSNPPAKKPAFEIPAWAYALAGVIGLPLLLYFVPLLIIASFKRRRRRRRRRAGPGDRQAAGSWDELTDAYAELGFSLPVPATRLQTADALEKQSEGQGLALPEQGLRPLAGRVDEAVFAAADVEHSRVEALWSETAEIVALATSRAGWLRRRIASFRYHRRQNSAAKSTRRNARRDAALATTEP
ncbi:MAG TPA: transglutaminase-like domain-containing protein [Microbacteriaceae bacterium]